ncbi:hypothetical protein FJZ28_03325 [Candidatus Peregrinibacteria bacterium]|nr:hypothetical protein [Candidatus Peregrinibacteria bacterium]
MSILDQKCLMSLDELQAALEKGEPSEVEKTLRGIYDRMEGVLDLPDEGNLTELLTELKALIYETMNAFPSAKKGDSAEEY